MNIDITKKIQEKVVQANESQRYRDLKSRIALDSVLKSCALYKVI